MVGCAAARSRRAAARRLAHRVHAREGLRAVRATARYSAEVRRPRAKVVRGVPDRRGPADGRIGRRRTSPSRTTACSCTAPPALAHVSARLDRPLRTATGRRRRPANYRARRALAGREPRRGARRGSERQQPRHLGDRHGASHDAGSPTTRGRRQSRVSPTARRSRGPRSARTSRGIYVKASNGVGADERLAVVPGDGAITQWSTYRTARSFRRRARPPTCSSSRSTAGRNALTPFLNSKFVEQRALRFAGRPLGRLRVRRVGPAGSTWSRSVAPTAVADLARGTDPQWSADGRELFFIAADGAFTSVPIVPGRDSTSAFRRRCTAQVEQTRRRNVPPDEGRPAFLWMLPLQRQRHADDGHR